MENLKYRQPAFLPGAVLICILLSAVSGLAQSSNTASTIKRICPINQPLPAGLKVRSVKVLGRRGDGPVEQQLEAEKSKLPNREYTSDFHNKAMEIVELALTDEANQSFEKQLGILGGARTTKLGIATIYTTPCVEIENDEVDVIVRVLFIRVDVGNPANNLLTLPRSLAPSFYQHMPAFLRGFNPNFDVDYDRRTGPVAAVKLSTNLAELPSLLSGKQGSDGVADDGEAGADENEDEDGPQWRADLDFIGRKSLTERFYQTQGNLALTRLRPSRFIEKLDAAIGFHATDEPLSEMRRVKNGLTLSALIKLRPHGRLLNAVHLSADYSRNVNKVFESGVQLISERDSRGSFRSVLDARIVGGFARAGVWFDTTEISRTATSYRRLASAFGYQKEIGAGTQTLGVEALFGAGKSWGDVPLYARFYGGSNTANFLYEAPDSPLMIEFPTGPVLRSYGQTQAGVGTTASGSARGGRSYWHANLNVAIPVRRWSQPLIPQEVVVRTDPDTGARTEGTLSDMLEGFSIGSAVGGIGDNLLDGIIEELMRNDPSLTEDEAAVKGAPLAEARAKEIVEREIAPAVRFIARRANLFAVKPLVMFDVASIGGVEGARRRLRFAAGGGVQFVVVIARAELGYMKSLPQIANEPKGNFVFKITFQNLF